MKTNSRNYMLALRQVQSNLTHLLEGAESMLKSVIAIREEIGQNLKVIDALLQKEGNAPPDVNRKASWKVKVGEIIQQVFTVPDPNDPDAVWMTPTEVMEELRKRRLIRADIAKYVAPWHVGGALRNLGFTRKMIYDNAVRLYKYSVKFCDESIRNTHIHTKLYI